MSFLNVNVYDQIEIRTIGDAIFEHPLKRRMTNMQLSVSYILYKFKNEHPDLWKIVTGYKSHIYYASQFGEIDLSAKLADAVYKREFPISPKDFQNSLYNIAMGYAAMLCELKNGYTCTSNGFLSFEKCFWIVCQKIANEIHESSLIIHSHGSENFQVHGHEPFKAELVCITSQDLVRTDIKLATLQEISLLHSRNEIGKYYSNSSIVISNKTEQMSWMGGFDKIHNTRLAINEDDNEGVYIRWST